MLVCLFLKILIYSVFSRFHQMEYLQKDCGGGTIVYMNNI